MVWTGLLCFGLSLCVSKAHARDGYERHIILVAHQAPLAHRLVRSVCLAHLDVNPEANRAIAIQTRDAMQHAFSTLKNGDTETGLAAITDGTITTQLSAVEMVFKGLLKKVDPFLAGEPLSDKDILKLTFKSESLTKYWRSIFHSLELKTTVYATPDRVAVARKLSFAGEQNLWLQQAGKEACLSIVAGGGEAASKQVTNLQGAVMELQANIFAITFGDQSRDLAPPNDAIEQTMFTIWQDWVALESLFDMIANSEVGRADLSDLSLSIEFLFQSFEEVLTQYDAL